MYPGQSGNGGNPRYGSYQSQHWMEQSPSHSQPIPSTSSQAGSGAGSLPIGSQPGLTGIYHPGSSPSSAMTHHSHQPHASHHYYPYQIPSPIVQRTPSFQSPTTPVTHHNINSNTYFASSPYSHPTMQSPPPTTMIGSPGQPFSHSSNQSNPSPSRSMSSPLSFPVGSPLMRQFSGSIHAGPPSAQGPPTTPSLHPLPPSPASSQSSVHSQPPPLSQTPQPPTPQPPISQPPTPQPPTPQSVAPQSVPSPAVPPSPKKPPPVERPPPPSPAEKKPVIANGKPATAPSVPAAIETVNEEPLPQYPTPEELEKMSQHIRPMIPEVMLNRIFSRAGLAFVDPKIGMLISFASQNLINDIVKEAAAVNQGQPKGQLTRKNLEKILQDRGMKQLGSDGSTSSGPAS